MDGHPDIERLRNRIVRYADVDPAKLVEHPMNWRAHPEHQKEALSGSLDEIGWISPVLVSEKTGHIIDGHLRVAIALVRNEPTVPVAYLDLSEAEESRALLALDAIAALAEANTPILDVLLGEAANIGGDPRLDDLFDEIAEQHGLTPPAERGADDPGSAWDAPPTDGATADGAGGGTDIAGDAYVPFKFGVYSGNVARVVYDKFVALYQATQKRDGLVMLDDVLGRLIDGAPPAR